jgi:hypothetical protein
LFNREFFDLLEISSPFMSDFQKGMVAKLMRGSGSESSTRQRELYEECLRHMAEGLLNSLMRIGEQIGSRRDNIQRLRKCIDLTLEDAPDPFPKVWPF